MGKTPGYLDTQFSGGGGGMGYMELKCEKGWAGGGGRGWLYLGQNLNISDISRMYIVQYIPVFLE